MIVVTGCAGFIGSHLALRLLSEGERVVGFDLVDKPPIRSDRFLYNRADVGDWFIPRGTTHVYHLASVVGVPNYMDDPLKVIDTTLNGTRRIAELCLAHRSRLLFTSTSEVYGRNPKVPWREDGERVLGPTSVDRWCYASSKALAEHVIMALMRKGLRASIVRFFNVYGPRQAPIYAVSKTLHHILAGERPEIHDDGNQTRCFTWIDDAIDGLIRAATCEHALGEVINIGSDREITINQLIRMMLDLAKSDLAPRYVARSRELGAVYEDIPRRVPDISKARRLLDWQPATSLEKGLALLIASSLANPWTMGARLEAA